MVRRREGERRREKTVRGEREGRERGYAKMITMCAHKFHTS